MEKSEKEIIERLNAKDKQAFEYVFTTHCVILQTNMSAIKKQLKILFRKSLPGFMKKGTLLTVY